MNVLAALQQSGASIIACLIRNTHTIIHKYSFRTLKNTLLKKVIWKITKKQWCMFFGWHSTIWGFNIDCLLRNTRTLAHKYSSKKIHSNNILSQKIIMEDYHNTMTHVCFERPKKIRGFNNRSLAKKYPYFSTKIQL